MKVLTITSYDAANQGHPTVVLEFPEGADEDALYCQWVRSKGWRPERTDDEIMEDSTDAWFVMDVQKLP